MKRSFFVLAALVLSVAPASANTVVERSFDASHARVLQVEAGGGNVALTPQTGSSNVRVVVNESAGLPKPQVAWQHSGNRIMLTISGGPTRSMLPFIGSSAIAYVVAYPASMRLDVRLSSGNVTVHGSTAAVEIYDDDGTIVADAPRAAVTAENGAGDITVTDAFAPLDLAADGGSVRASIAKGWSQGEIRMQSANGSVTLDLPVGFRGRFDTTASIVRNEFGASTARSPLVWLYAPAGRIWIKRGP
jgi:hypothetical protein